MGYILSNIDQLAPHCGTLLRHLDALLLYCDDDRRYLPALLDYLPILAPRLDALGPHLGLLRPHIGKVLPHLDVIAPCADRFAPYVAVSANADILLFYFSWALHLPGARLMLQLPGVPATAAFLSRRLPRRPVRGNTWDYECDWEGCETDYVANAERYYRKPAFSDPVRLAVRKALGERRARAAWWLSKTNTNMKEGRRGVRRRTRELLRRSPGTLDKLRTFVAAKALSIAVKPQPPIKKALGNAGASIRGIFQRSWRIIGRRVG
mmetsp:Transcript_6378/g.19379  ORF Transcript_6378/g.19379 Transcript_6378/m.19379 type:complete len:265 (+) Transcript_6378:142-936(+)